MVFVKADRPGVDEEQGRPTVPTFQDIGRLLSAAREEQNLTIKEVANKIYVRQQYLMALESGNLGDLPGRVYILGFIRNYARLLSLDGEELVRQVNAIPNIPDYERRHVPAIPSLSEEGPNMRFLFISAILVIFLGLSSYIFFKPESNVPHEESSSQKSVEVLTQAPVLSVPSDQEIVVTEAPDADIKQELEENDPVKKEIPLNMPTRQLNTPIRQPIPQKIVLKAKQPAWVEIRDSTGAVLLMKVLQAGQEYVVPEKAGLTLNTGNAGGIDIFVGETKLPSLGSYGQVKRDIRLESLRQTEKGSRSTTSLFSSQ